MIEKEVNPKSYFIDRIIWEVKPLKEKYQIVYDLDTNKMTLEILERNNEWRHLGGDERTKKFLETHRITLKWVN